MKISRSLCIATLLLAVAIVYPRMYAGTLLVKYDVLFWDSRSGGYVPTAIALGAKLLSSSLALAALVMIVKDRTRRWAWSLCLPVSVLSILSISMPSGHDLLRVINQGNRLVARIDSYHSKHGRYPSSLKAVRGVPQTGLARERRFYYATAQSKLDDQGQWFPGTRTYLGKSAYVICVPLVPGGTLVYRPNGDYSDLPGHAQRDGWYSTSRD